MKVAIEKVIQCAFQKVYFELDNKELVNLMNNEDKFFPINNMSMPCKALWKLGDRFEELRFSHTDKNKYEAPYSLPRVYVRKVSKT